MGDDVETVRGSAITIHFDHGKCIHARQCVLGLPQVFVPNVRGAWIHPDAAPAEDIAALARSCPSGAIRYQRHDGAADEAPPPVNLVRIRERGPLAFHGELTIGDQPALRATLCRCGASQRKPYCDGSHATCGFEASGEPATRTSEPLAERAGPLTITPAPDGPLLVTGNLEVVSGTGRTVDRVEKCALCRCGQSGNKPYCDGTHRKIGWKS
jgi:CDGSH-type Zn-finger protein/uncharacterized Fe-S cluster protein YjdI